jgi:predicted amino acid-binding ACT domain protein
MQVLGGLIHIPASEITSLPLSWWHRAPLGLINDTGVFVALTEVSKERPVADLIVTVLDPNKWDRMFRLECSHKDKPGLVAQVFSAVYPLNIALAETVKVEKGGLHHLTLICEPASEQQDVKKEIPRIKQILRKKGFDIQEPQPLPPLPKTIWHRAGLVEHGWVRGISWRAEIERRWSAESQLVDLERVVVSADTENRILRYVFPRRGAMTVRIRHADLPGALEEITKALQKCNLNILSALLRRGGGKGVDAELVAVCEPSTSGSESCGTDDAVKNLQSQINQKFRPQISANTGVNASETIYSRHPEEVAARVPENILGEYKKEKKKLSEQMGGVMKTPIFLSRRFPGSQNEAAKIAEDVRHALVDNHCVPVEAEPTMGRAPNTIYTEVSAKLWASGAGIVLVVRETAEKPPLNMNLAYEWGFLLGQGKSVLVLVEDVPECWEILHSFTNIAGLVVQGFARSAPSSQSNSLHAIISAWITELKFWG